ncbi:MAG: FAD-dependent monooxygenase [Pseudonocardiaceae bacterium]
MRGAAVVLGEVLVVGAGPVGLTVGIELLRRGVPCRVVDRLVEAPQYGKAVGHPAAHAGGVGEPWCAA